MNHKLTDEYFLGISDQIAEASTCRVNIGTIIVQNKLIVAPGYVGSVSGDHHCNHDDSGSAHRCLLVDNHGLKGSSPSGKSCIRTVHSEMNAVLKCPVRGKEGNWLECYTTYSPCLDCLKALLQIGVRKIVYRKEYKDVHRDLFIANMHESLKSKLELIHIPL